MISDAGKYQIVDFVQTESDRSSEEALEWTHTHTHVSNMAIWVSMMLCCLIMNTLNMRNDLRMK